MPAPTPELTVAQATERALACFAPGEGGGRIGLEVEWVVIDPAEPARTVPAAEVDAAARAGGPLPAAGSITLEPGGQLELSSDHGVGPRAALDLVTADAAALTTRLERAGLAMLHVGLDPHRIGVRTLDLPRYRAIEEVFDRSGPSGMALATSSAATQINVDAGPDPVRTWRTASAIGPVLAAASANSPMHRGRRTGWRSTRQLLWSTVPGGRSRPVPTWSAQAWVDVVLDTDVLSITHDDEATALPGGFPMRRWIEQGHELGYPTPEDLDVHLTTLFPPVRPRGYLELRMVDTVPSTTRDVLVAVAATLLTHDDAGRAAVDACRHVAGRWTRAARDGLADPALAAAAVVCLDLAADAVGDTDLAEACRAWRDRYPARGRSPADDVVDDLARSAARRGPRGRTLGPGLSRP